MERARAEVAPVPADDALRVRALRQYGILDTPPEESFDRITRLASEILGTPFATIALIDGDRQWFKSRKGLDIDGSAREFGFSAHAIMNSGVLVVPDTLEDTRFRANPYVIGEPHVRFYAGAPLETAEGFRIGALSVTDLVPRQLSPDQIQALRDLAGIAINEIELRRVAGAAVSEERRIRERAENFLQNSERRYRQLVELSPDAVWVNSNGKIAFANRATASLLRVDDPRALVGRPYEYLFPEEIRPVIADRARELLAGRMDMPAWLEHAIICEDGSETIVESSAAVIDWYGTRSSVVIFRDLTESKIAEQAAREKERRLHELQQQLSDLSQSDAIVELASALSHELNQPLAAIMNYLEAATLVAGLGGTTSQRTGDLVERALAQADRAARILRGLKDLSVRGITDRNLESLEEVISEVSTLGLSSVQALDVTVRLDIAPDLPRVRINKVQIQQVLLNLIRNALEAMDGAADKVLSISAALCDHDFILVTVADSGPGIASDVLDRIFAPFVTSKPTNMGLGLAICQSLVHAHDGSISARPGNDGGTVISFKLPVARDEE